MNCFFTTHQLLLHTVALCWVTVNKLSNFPMCWNNGGFYLWFSILIIFQLLSQNLWTIHASNDIKNIRNSISYNRILFITRMLVKKLFHPIVLPTFSARRQFNASSHLTRFLRSFTFGHDVNLHSCSVEKIEKLIWFFQISRNKRKCHSKKMLLSR